MIKHGEIKQVSRKHDIKYSLYMTAEIENQGKDEIYKAEEAYKGKVVSSYYVDSNYRKVVDCDKCDKYVLRSAIKINYWLCPKHKKLTDKIMRERKLKRDMRESLEARVKCVAYALRKMYPH